MMRYEAQVIAILPVPDTPPRWWDDTRPIQARYDARSLGYEVRAPARPEDRRYEYRKRS